MVVGQGVDAGRSEGRLDDEPVGDAVTGESAAGAGVVVRMASPSDFTAIVAVVDQWWGRPVRHVLPRLFLDHFYRTSLIAERSSGGLGGFLIGFCSPSVLEEAYIHFLAVAPDLRGQGLARSLYQRFFALARQEGRGRVRAVTSPVNTGSIAFHQRMGFSVTYPDATDSDQTRVRFCLDLASHGDG